MLASWLVTYNRERKNLLSPRSILLLLLPPPPVFCSFLVPRGVKFRNLKRALRPCVSAALKLLLRSGRWETARRLEIIPRRMQTSPEASEERAPSVSQLSTSAEREKSTLGRRNCWHKGPRCSENCRRKTFCLSIEHRRNVYDTYVSCYKFHNNNTKFLSDKNNGWRSRCL